MKLSSAYIISFFILAISIGMGLVQKAFASPSENNLSVFFNAAASDSSRLTSIYTIAYSLRNDNPDSTLHLIKNAEKVFRTKIESGKLAENSRVMYATLLNLAGKAYLIKAVWIQALLIPKNRWPTPKKLNTSKGRPMPTLLCQ